MSKLTKKLKKGLLSSAKFYWLGLFLFIPLLNSAVTSYAAQTTLTVVDGYDAAAGNILSVTGGLTQINTDNDALDVNAGKGTNLANNKWISAYFTQNAIPSGNTITSVVIQFERRLNAVASKSGSLYLDVSVNRATTLWSDGTLSNETGQGTNVNTYNVIGSAAMVAESYNITSLISNLTDLNNLEVNFRNDSTSFKEIYIDFVRVIVTHADTTAPNAVTDLESRIEPTLGDVTLNWTATGDDGATGTLNNSSFTIQHSTYSGVVWSSNTAQVVIATTSVTAGSLHDYTLSLNPNTTYFFRLWTKDDGGNPSAQSNVTSTVTLANLVTGVQFGSIYKTSATISWTALPTTPSSASARGYLLQASSTNFDGTGSIYSNSTSDGSLSTLSVTGLSSNTTYFFRVGSLNWNQTANFQTAITTATHVLEPTLASPTFTNVQLSSISVQWLDGGNAAGTPYQIQISSNSFSSIITSSITTNLNILFGTGGEGIDLAHNTTHQVRVAALNQNDILSAYTILGSTVTLAQPPTALANAFSTIGRSSMTVTWTDPLNPTNTRYQVDLSTNNFSTIWATTRTTNLTRLFGTGGYGTTLSANTTHFARVKSINHGGHSSSYTGLGSTSTLANAPTTLSASQVYASSMSVSWTIPTKGAEGFRLEGSSTNFNGTGTTTSSETVNASATQLSILNPALQANTTYYVRAGARNHNNLITYSTIKATSTLANKPGSPAVASVHSTSVTVNWSLPSNGAEGYKLQASTSSSFTGTLLSQTTTDGAATTLTVQGLNSETIYYFRVGSYNWRQKLNYELAGSTTTDTTDDAIAPDTVNDLTVSTYSATELLLQWTAPNDPYPAGQLNGNYAIQYSTWSGVSWSTPAAQIIISTSNVTPGSNQQKVVDALNPNTTYYFKIWTSDLKPNWADQSNEASNATLSNLPANIFFTSVNLSSASLTWDAFPGAPQSDTANGYVIEASTMVNFTGTIYQTSTAVLSQSTLTLTGLSANTTHYFRVGSLNLNNAPNYAAVLATSTLANLPIQLSYDFTAASTASITAQWAALPATPQNSTSEGFTLEASSTNFNGTGTLYSSQTANVLLSTLTVANLSPNVNYYFRVGSLNWNQSPHYTTLSATSTLAKIPSSISIAQTNESSATVSWGIPTGGTYGYKLEASSTNFNGSGVTRSSLTANGSATSLTVSNLLLNTTYYFRAGSLNYSNAINFGSSLSTSTLADAPSTLSEDFIDLGHSSATVHWAALPASPREATSEGYRLEASSTNFNGTGTTYSSQTVNVLLSTLTISGLSINTRYYFKTGSLNWRGGKHYTVLSNTSTLANEPLAAALTYTSVANTSLTAQWLANSNPSWTNYRLQVSTYSNFIAAVQSSTTLNTSAQITNLSPNLTYYARVQALNLNSVGSAYLNLGSTVTHASTPGTVSPAFSPIYHSSLTVNFSSGTPANPSGTTYTVQVSTQADFSSVTTSSTLNVSASFTSLQINTTYYARVKAQNKSGAQTSYTSLGNKVTLAVEPNATSPAFSGVTSKVITFYWSSGTVSGGYNSTNTIYHTQISKSAGFGIIIDETDITGLSHTFSGLESNTLYYLRAKAINHQGTETNYVVLGSTQTDPSSLPVFLNSTFLVTNSSGDYVDGTGWTDTVTPNILVNVQSNQSPGLSVTDTPSMLGYWHMDAGSGTILLDSSTHNNDLAASGTPYPTWGTGQLGYALNFNAGNSWMVSGDLSPHRTTTANNIFTVELWFKGAASDAVGHLWSINDRNLTLNGNADNQIGWVGGVITWRMEPTNLLQAAASYADDQWHYLAAVLGSNGSYLYVDGVQVDSDPAFTNTSASTYAGAVYAWVGASTRRDGFDTSQYTSAEVDEVRLSTVALTAAEISSNYNLGKVYGHKFGSPAVDISTQAGANFTWSRINRSNWAIAPGTNGTLSLSSFSVTNITFRETTSPSAGTNKIKFFATDLDSGLTTKQYTISIDTHNPTNVAMSSFTSVSTKTFTAYALTAVDSLSGLLSAPYYFEASTHSNFSSIFSNSGYVTPKYNSFTNLFPNTTYYVRVEAVDNAGNNSAKSSAISTVTLSLPVENISIVSTERSSITVTWDAFSVSPSSMSAYAYLLEVSSTNFAGPTIISSQTTAMADNSLTATNLNSNTTYYFRVGTLNWAGNKNYVSAGSTSTYSDPVTSVSMDAVYHTSSTLSWSLPTIEAVAYILQASTLSSFNPITSSSQTTTGSETTLSVFSLNPNTTYYFRVGAVNNNEAITYSTSLSTISKVNPATTINLDYIGVSSASISWGIPSYSSKYFRLDASTSSSFAEGTVISSQSVNGSQSNLIVSSLEPNKLYYFQVVSFNWANAPQYESAGSSSTRTNEVENPVIQTVDITTITVSWTTPAGGADRYILQGSTNSDFSSPLISSITLADAATSLSINSLSPNTTYFLRLGAGNISSHYVYTTLGGTSTLTNPPTNPTVLGAFVSSATLAWSVPSGTVSGFIVQASTAADFLSQILSSVTYNSTLSTLTVQGLNSESVYYLRVGAFNWNGVIQYSSSVSTETLVSVDSIPPDPINDLTVSTLTSTSLSLSWLAPLDPYPAGQLSGNYAIQYATYSGVSWSTTTAQVIFSTSNVTAGSAQSRTIGSLKPNTTYYFKVWTSDLKPNWSESSNEASKASLSNKVSNLSYFTIGANSAKLKWTSLPGSPSSSTASGYTLQASLTSNYSSPISSSGFNVNISSLGVSGLAANTTYYFRVASLNRAAAPNYQTISATSSLASPVTRLSGDYITIASSTIKAQWAALPPSPQTSTSEGYILQASTTDFNGSGTIKSSSTINILLSTLTVGSLSPNKIYYLRVGSLNWKGGKNFVSLNSTATLAGYPTSVSFSSIQNNQATLSWGAPTGGSSGFKIMASSTNFSGAGDIISSSTVNSAATSLTASGLLANTTYYFRAGSLNQLGGFNYQTTLATSTLANAPSRDVSDYVSVFRSSVTAQWQALPTTPQNLTAEGYQLEASSTNFNGTGTVALSSSSNVNTTSLDLTGLSVNTTYYFRVGSLNWNLNRSYTVLDTTSTRANSPVSIASTFTSVQVSSITLQWSGNSNPTGTSYKIELSTFSNFSGGISTTLTNTTNGSVTGLSPSSLYYARVQAINRQGSATEFINMGSTITRSAKPGAASLAFTPVNRSSFTVHFTSGSPTNPAGTTYYVEISTLSNFSSVTVLSTTSLARSFTSLLINTTYFARARSYNGYLYSDYTSLGSTPTLATQPGTVSPTYSGVTNKTITVAFSSGTASLYNSPGSRYTLEISKSAGFSPLVQSGATTNLSYTFSGLESSTLYYLRVKAVNHRNISTSYTSLGSTTTVATSIPFYITDTFQVTNSLGQYIDADLYTDTKTVNVKVNLQSNNPPGLSVTNTPSMLMLWHLNAGSGSTTVDSSLHSKTGTFTGVSPTWGTGQTGSSLDFSAGDGWVYSTNLSPYRNSAAHNIFSIELWFKATVTESIGILYSESDRNTSLNGTADNQIGWASGVLTWRLEPVNNLTAPSAYNDNQWHYAAAVLGASGSYLYVDGVQVDSDPAYTNASAQTYAGTIYGWIGSAGRQDTFDTSRYTTAQVDEVRLSTVALSASEIWANYQLGKTYGHLLGAPAVDYSTYSGTNFTWVRVSTANLSIAPGSNGTVNPSTITVTSVKLIETASPGAQTNKIKFFNTDLQSGLATSQYTILIDVTPPDNDGMSALTNVTTESIKAAAFTASDDLAGLASLPYLIEASTKSNFSIIDSSSQYISLSSYTFSGLYPHTTYYFRVTAKDNAGAGNTATSTNTISTATLSVPVQNIVIQSVYLSSTTLTWDALPVLPSSSSAQGYRLDASSTNFNGGDLITVSTDNVAGNTLTVPSLLSNTTYYFRVGSLNWNNIPNYSSAGSTSTLADVVTSTSITSVFITSTTVSWTIPSGGAKGYELQASTNSDFSGTPISSVTANGIKTSLTTLVMDSNTTYYFRVGSINANSVRRFTTAGSTVTKVNQVQSPSFTSVQISSVVVSWSAPTGGASGYQVDASTHSNFADPVESSSTIDGGATTLTVFNLEPFTTYYFRVASINRNNEFNYVVLGATSTLTNAVTSPLISQIDRSSATVTWAVPTGGSNGYTIDASTMSDYSGTPITTSTVNGGDTSILVEALETNTTYYFRVGSINWNDVVVYEEAGSTSTRANPPMSPVYSAVDISSITATWGTPTGGATGFELQASTVSNFSETIYYSSTTNGAATSLVVSGLTPNTTYFLRVAALNWNNSQTFETISATATRTNLPTSPLFSMVAISSATVQWTAPAGTVDYFELEASTNSNFSDPVLTSLTNDGEAAELTIIAMTPNSTYYFRVGAYNWNDVVNYSDTLSTATYAGAPSGFNLVSANISSATLNWTAPVDGSNGFRLEASSYSNFSLIAVSSETSSNTSTTLTVNPLDPNTTYYFRVGSLNWGDDIVYASSLSTSTLANAPTGLSGPTINSSSASITWSLPTGGATGFRLEASTMSNFSGTVISSTTPNDNSTGLTLTSMLANTTYYFRSAAINWNNRRTYSTNITTATRSNRVTRKTPDVISVYNSSITVRWIALPTTPQSSTAESYLLEASSTNFNGTGTVYPTSTSTMALSTLTVTGLEANLTYYFRVATLNWNGAKNYQTLNSSSTLASTPTAPGFVSVFKSSAIVTWGIPTNGAEGFKVEASTKSNFSGTVLSSITFNGSSTQLTILSLISDTTYYFRVGSYNWNRKLNYTTIGATQTQTSIDPIAPDAVTDLSALTIDESSVYLSWTAPNDPTDSPLSGTYYIQYTTWTGVSLSTTVAQVSIATSNVTAGDPQGVLINGLMPNSTHYFYIWTNDIKPNTSGISNGATAATLADIPTSVSFISVLETTATISWAAFPVLPSSAAAEGFILEVSSNAGFTGTVLSSASTSGVISSLEVTNMLRNTTYYFRLGSLNWNNATNYAATISTSSLSQEPIRLSTDFISVSTNQAVVQWAALPSSPDENSSEGYLVQASSTDFNGSGTIYSSQTANVLLSTLTISSLEINTTYYFRVGSLNWNGFSNFTTLGATSTLTKPPVAAASTFTMVAQSSITVAYLANGNPSNTLYQVDLSTASDFTGTLTSSSVYALNTTLINLTPSTTYFARVKALNHNSVSSAYLSLGSTVTLPSVPGATSPIYTPVNISSLTVHFTAGTPANGAGTVYEVDLSSYVGFNSAYSSNTLNSNAGFTSLSVNTTYYSRVRARNFGGSVSAYTSLSSTATLAATPGTVASTFTSIGNRSFTITWSATNTLGQSNPSGTIYRVQISTSAGFTADISTISTTNTSAGFSGLDTGTTYYARVRALNHSAIPTAYQYLSSVTTLPTSEPEFTLASFEITDSQGAWIDPSLYTDTTTPNVRINLQSYFSPGLAVTKTDSDKVLWHMDEGGGVQSVDSSMHSNHLNLTGSPKPTWETGRIGSALGFDGSQNYAVSSTNLTEWRKNSSNNAWTIEMWFKASGNSGFLFQSANSNTLGASSFDADIAWHNTSGYISFALRTSGGAQRIAQSDASYADGDWHYLAAVLNSAGMYIYVDGSEKGSNTNISASTAKVYSSAIYAWVGAASQTDSNMGNGSTYSSADIDEVRISTVALSAAQIADNYTLGQVYGHALGGPSIDVSTMGGNAFTWVRISTNNLSISGTNGTTALQTMTGSGLSLIQSTEALADTNQILFIARSLDGIKTTSQFTILVDTTAPTNIGVNTLTSVTTDQIDLTLLTAIDPLSGLTASPYTIDISSVSNFNPLTATTGLTGSTSHSFTSLNPHTTYYIRVKAIDNAGNESDYSTAISTPTQTLPVSGASFTSVNRTTVTISWTPLGVTPSSMTANGYRIQASTSSSFAEPLLSSQTSNVGLGFLTISGLTTNTSYYFRVGSLTFDDSGNYVDIGATTTFANPPTNSSFTAVYISSAVVAWDLPAGSNNGFVVEASTAQNFTGLLLSSSTSNPSATTLTVFSLLSETTYYFRVGATNLDNTPNYDLVIATETQTSIDPTPPNAITNLTAVVIDEGSINLSWTAPLDPTDIPLDGTYFIHYATSTSITPSTMTSQVSFSTSGVSAGDAQARVVNSLDPNTTYYFTIWAQDIKPNTSGLSNAATAATLANIPENLSFVDVVETSATISWTAFPITPSSSTTEGFILEASSHSDFSTGVISSQTSSGLTVSLGITGMDENTTYYFRTGSLNWVSIANYSAAISTSTLAKKVSRLSSDFANIYASSITIQWQALAASPRSESSEGYLLEGSSTNFNGSGVLHSSQTASSGDADLTLSSLLVNVTYYFRAGALNSNEAANYVTLNATSTLSAIPLADSPDFSLVGTSSITAQWLANGNSNTTLYELDISTLAGFSSLIDSTSTLEVAYNFTSLNPNVTYYSRVRSINNNNIPSAYLSLGSTVTHTTEPDLSVVTFTPVNKSSMTVYFTSGTPPNPTGTTYRVQVAIDDVFTTPISFETTNTNYEFTGLSINTTYYARVQSENYIGFNSGFVALGATATLAATPGSVVSTYTSVANRSFTLNWESGTVAGGFNPTGTLFTAEISTHSDFSFAISTSQTTNAATSFGGLQPGGTYYSRVRAENHQALRTEFVYLGSVTTLPSSEPTFFAETFQVTNALGSYIDGTTYTDTTTVNVRVNVQSNFAPGLAVTDTPAFIGLWHLDDASGTSAYDYSYHSNPLTLTGAPPPSWTASGYLGGAITMDGTQNYTVTANDLSPWRDSSSNNGWTVEFWFKTSSNSGFLFQTANSQSAGASNFDAAIAWHSTSGNLTFGLRNTGGSQRLAESGSSYADDNWHHVAAVLNSAGMYLYIDGAQQASNTTVNSSSAKIYSTGIYAWFGASSQLDSNLGNGTKFSTADMDDIRISTNPFTASQISQNYNLGVQGHILGGPSIDVSTTGGHFDTWTRLSTGTISMGGTNGTTAVQSFGGTGLQVVQSTEAASLTNQVMFIATDLDGNLTTAQFTILVDTTAPTNNGISSFQNTSSTTIEAVLLTAVDLLSGLDATPYNIDVSTVQAFNLIFASSNFMASTTYEFINLQPNTTHYFRSQSKDAAGNSSDNSTLSSEVTLSVTVNDASFLNVFETSATLNWTALPSSPQSATSEGYVIQASTDSNYNGDIFSTSTADANTTELSVTGLTQDLTYYFRIGTLNWVQVANYVVVGSTVTGDGTAPASITNLSGLQSILGGEIDLTWTAPGDDGTSGVLTSAEFIVQYTTVTSFNSWDPVAANPGQVYRTNIATDNVNPGTTISHSLTGLISGGTYYLRAWTRDEANNYSPISNGATVWATAINLGVELSSHTLYYGSLSPGTTALAASSFTVTNTGNVVETFALEVINPSVWTATTSVAYINTFRLTALFKDSQPNLNDFDIVDDVLITSTRAASSTDFAITGDAAGEKGFTIQPGESRELWIRIEMPKISSTDGNQVIRLRAVAIKE